MLVFFVDFNEVSGENGDLFPVSMDYTCNAGPGVLDTSLPRPGVGEQVYVLSDDDGDLYKAQVVSITDERDLVVCVDWPSRHPVHEQHCDLCAVARSYLLP